MRLNAICVRWNLVQRNVIGWNESPVWSGIDGKDVRGWTAAEWILSEWNLSGWNFE